MTPITHILERRLLAALAQAATTRLPAPWRQLRPEQPSNLRPAAAVLLGVAEEASRERMTASLKATAARIRKRRDDREGGEVELFRKTAELVDTLGEMQDPTASHLPGLRLWTLLPKHTLGPILKPFNNLAPKPHPVSEPWLTEAARVLLRARAQAWEDEARAEEGGARAGSSQPVDPPTTEGAAS